MKIKGSKILITGGSKGLGKATAKMLADEGAQVIITARNEKELKQTADELGIDYIVADVSNEEDVKRIYQVIQEKWGGLDVLINNAGLARGHASIDQVALADYQYVFGVNVFGAAMMAKYAAQIFMKQKSGNIVNIASTAALNGYKGGSIYSASKFALRSMTQSWQAELRPYNVRVFGVNPTYVPTAFGTVDGKEKPLEANKVAPDDIAHAIVSALKIDKRAFIPELTVWATNPW